MTPDSGRTTTPVTVLMSVYNGEEYLREAVDSIPAQTFADFEFLIINDGSTDGTRNILESYDDPRIRLIHQENIGLTRSLNKGIRLARGEYIARMDADDISLPARLQLQMNMFTERPDLAVVATGAYRQQPDRVKFVSRSFSHATLPALLLMTENPIIHASIAYRRRDVMAVGGYDERCVAGQDRDLWLRLAWEGYRFGLVEEPVYVIREHPGSISWDHHELQLASTVPARARIIRRFRANPPGFGWVDRESLWNALVEFAWEWQRKRPSAAREAALALLALKPADGTGYRLLARSAPGAASVTRLADLLRRACKSRPLGRALLRSAARAVSRLRPRSGQC